MTETLLDRFLAKVAFTDGCWLWVAAKDELGYGRFRVSEDQTVLPHRWLWEVVNGPIPEGLVLDHLCRNPSCVRPDPEHLEPVTQRVNLLRGETVPAHKAAQTHCKRGHPLTGDNLYLRPANRHGIRWRGCLICRHWHSRYVSRSTGS